MSLPGLTAITMEYFFKVQDIKENQVHSKYWKDREKIESIFKKLSAKHKRIMKQVEIEVEKIEEEELEKYLKGE